MQSGGVLQNRGACPLTRRRILAGVAGAALSGMAGSLLWPGAGLGKARARAQVRPGAGTAGSDGVGQAASGASGVVGVAQGRRYFVDEKGEPFLIIGQNDAITWPYLDALLAGDEGPARAYLDELAAAGVNTSRMMAEYAQLPFGLLEDPVGVYNPAVVEFWDRFLPMAAERGIRVLLTPWDPFWMDKNWDDNPWNRSNGGPLTALRDLITSEEGRAAQKRRWQFIVERWGDSPAIFGWELLNEIELWFGANARQIEAWITELAAFVRDAERRKWGRTHLITTSTATAFPDGKLGDVIFGHPDLDFATTHLYTAAIGDPQDAAQPALEVALAVAYALASMPSPRPYLDTESGPINRWIGDPVFDALYYHHMSWAHLAAGGAGQGLRWPYRTPHVLSPEMRAVQGAMARFFEGSREAVDWGRFNPRPLAGDVRVEPPPGFPEWGPGPLRALEVVGSADPESGVALVWVVDTVRSGAVDARREPPVVRGAQLLVAPEVLAGTSQWASGTSSSGMSSIGTSSKSPSGAAGWEARAWDTWTGRPLGPAEVRGPSTTSGPVTIFVPPFARDVVVVLTRTG